MRRKPRQMTDEEKREWERAQREGDRMTLLRIKRACWYGSDTIPQTGGLPGAPPGPIGADTAKGAVRPDQRGIARRFRKGGKI